ncbi:outer membrane protein assembly factor BamB [Methylomarinum sp. Ch1-1]|uniref:Outer membrane protein assembly factor BamB n=1 Tax=Methylomarinum roseum TaxID=3067653 RepID=A0AAU7NUC2_9GAMM
MLKNHKLLKLLLPLLWAALPLLNGCAALEAGKELVGSASSYFLGGEDNTEPPAPLTEYEAEIEIERLWRESTGDGTDDQYLKLAVSVSYGKVLSADRGGLIIARDSQTGEVVWETETDFAFSAGPGSGIETVIMGTSNAEVVAFDIDSGEQKWVTEVSSEVLAVPVIAQGKVLVRTIDGKIIALSEKDGSQQWVFERNVPALSIRGTGSPIIVEDNVIAGYANGKIMALRLDDGKNIWETSIAIPSGRSEVERLVDLDVDPVATEGVIFIASYQGGTSAVLEIDGDVLWHNEDVSSYSGISYDWRYLYVSDSSSDVWQLDQRNGAALWKQDALRFRRLTTPVAYDNFVVVGDFAGYVHWLAGSDGRQLGRTQVTEAAIEARPVVVDNTVYIYAKDGTLAAYKVRKK